MALVSVESVETVESVDGGLGPRGDGRAGVVWGASTSVHYRRSARPRHVPKTYNDTLPTDDPSSLLFSAAASPHHPHPHPPPDDHDEDASTTNGGGGDRYGCVCGVDEEIEGDLMIQCERCLEWQHCACVGVEDTEGKYFCEKCEPEGHPYFAKLAREAALSTNNIPSSTTTSTTSTSTAMAKTTGKGHASSRTHSSHNHHPPSSSSSRSTNNSTSSSLHASPSTSFYGNAPQPSSSSTAQQQPAGKKRNTMNSRDAEQSFDFLIGSREKSKGNKTGTSSNEHSNEGTRASSPGATSPAAVVVGAGKKNKALPEDDKSELPVPPKPKTSTTAKKATNNTNHKRKRVGDAPPASGSKKARGGKSAHRARSREATDEEVDIEGTPPEDREPWEYEDEPAPPPEEPAEEPVKTEMEEEKPEVALAGAEATEPAAAAVDPAASTEDEAPMSPSAATPKQPRRSSVAPLGAPPSSTKKKRPHESFAEESEADLEAADAAGNATPDDDAAAPAPEPKPKSKSKKKKDGKGKHGAKSSAANTNTAGPATSGSPTSTPSVATTAPPKKKPLNPNMPLPDMRKRVRMIQEYLERVQASVAEECAAEIPWFRPGWLPLSNAPGVVAACGPEVVERIRAGRVEAEAEAARVAAAGVGAPAREGGGPAEAYLPTPPAPSSADGAASTLPSPERRGLEGGAVAEEAATAVAAASHVSPPVSPSAAGEPSAPPLPPSEADAAAKKPRSPPTTASATAAGSSDSEAEGRRKHAGTEGLEKRVRSLLGGKRGREEEEEEEEAGTAAKKVKEEGTGEVGMETGKEERKETSVEVLLRLQKMILAWQEKWGTPGAGALKK
ncbi:hypothetical protein HDU96_009119 [Phlyctochytrium bullatum]|nr:hypothetical protein HDU96_009119 [Phlyctochytrium bullatum]